MDLVAVVLALLLAASLVAIAVLWTRLRAAPERLEAERVAWDAAARQREADLAAARTAAADGAEREKAAQAAASAAEARLEEARAALGAGEAERRRAVAARDEAQMAAAEAERRSAVLEETLRQMEGRIAEFERLKAEFLDATRAATFATAQQISSKLLEDHKRESAEAAQARDAHIQLATRSLIEQFEQIRVSVSELKGQVGEKGAKVDNLWRALTTPSGIGSFAEVGLANVLRSFSLEEGRDFVLQLTAADADTGRRLRPDAVVFLPGDTVLVIDCKASKFLHDIGAAEGADSEAEAYTNLARTMNAHMKALEEREYAAAVAAECRRSGRGEPLRSFSLMYLPSDGAVEKLMRADREFLKRTAQKSIKIVGPTGLFLMIDVASRQITEARRLEEHDRIVEGAAALLDGLTEVLKHAMAVGKGIKHAADSYVAFAASVNKRLLSRARRLERSGVTHGKPLPAPLPAYHVNAEDGLIEGEAEELEVRPRLVAERR